MMAHEIVVNIMANIISGMPLHSQSHDLDVLLKKKVQDNALHVLCDVLENMIREDIIPSVPTQEKKKFAEELQKLAANYIPISNRISGLLALL